MPTIWPVSWPLPAISSASPGNKRIDPAQDRLGPVADLIGIRASRKNRGADRGGLFGARVVVGHIKHIGMGLGRRAHQRALQPIPVATCAEDHDDPPHHMRAQRLQRGLDRIRRMGVIDIDRRPVPPRRRQAASGPAPRSGAAKPASTASGASPARNGQPAATATFSA